MLSKLTSASAPTATLAAIFSIFANRIMLLFVSFLPKMCSQLLRLDALACSWLPIPRFRPCGRADAAAAWFSTLVKSKYICEPTSDERSAGNLHATFCGSRGAGDRPRPPGDDQRWSSPTIYLKTAWEGKRGRSFPPGRSRAVRTTD